MANKINAEYSGATYKLSADVDDCKNGSVSFETTDEWISLSNDGKSPSILTIPETEDNFSRTAYIHTYLNYENDKGEMEKKECGKYNINISQNGAPCVCNSFNISSFTVIPRNGLASGTTMFSVEKKNSRSICEYVNFRGRLVDDNGTNYPLEMVGQQMQLQREIVKNNTLNNIGYTISASYVLEDGSIQECKSDSLTQPAVDCSCSNLTEINFIYNLQNTIPYEGVTVPAGSKLEIGTYKLNDYCDYMKGKIVCGNNTYRLELKCSTSSDLTSGKIYLLDSIPGNDEQGRKTFTMSVYYNSFSSTPCYTAKTMQDSSCACVNIKKYTYYHNNSGAIPQEGLTAGTTMLEYEVGTGNCGTLKAKEINNKFTLTANYNTSTHKGTFNLSSAIAPNEQFNQERTYKIQTYYDFGGGDIQNCSAFTFTQPGLVPCTCTSITETKFIEVIGKDGIPAGDNNKIVEYWVTSAHCADYVTGYMSGDTRIDLVNVIDANNNKHGYLKLPSNVSIPRNDDYVPFYYDINVVWSGDADYEPARNNVCIASGVTQNSKIECNCEDMSEFIHIIYGDTERHLITLPYGGWTDYTLVASAETAIYAEHDSRDGKYKKGDLVKVCGIVSATSTVDFCDLIPSEETIFHSECGDNPVGEHIPLETIISVGCGAYYDEEHQRQVPNHQFYFYVKAKPNLEHIPKTGFVNLWFQKYNDDGTLAPISECTDSRITMEYAESSCECSNFPSYVGTSIILESCSATPETELVQLWSYSSLPSNMYWFAPSAATSVGGEPLIVDIVDSNEPIDDEGRHKYSLSGRVVSTYDDDSPTVRSVGIIYISGYCEPTFSDPIIHNSSTWTGEGIKCKQAWISVNQPPCERCSCNYLTYKGIFDYADRASVSFGETDPIGKIYDDSVLYNPTNIGVEDCEIAWAFFPYDPNERTCAEDPILKDDDQTRFKGMNSDDPYQPEGAWFRVWFEEVYYYGSNTLNIKVELLSAPTETTTEYIWFKFGIKVYNEEGKYVDDSTGEIKRYDVIWCDCYSMKISYTVTQQCGNCNSQFNTGETIIRTFRCEESVYIAYGGRCAKAKLVPYSEGWANELTDEQAYQTYDWLQPMSAGGGWSSAYTTSNIYVYIDTEKYYNGEEGTTRDMYFMIYYADDTESGTYKGETCKKKVLLQEQPCIAPKCYGNECQRYYDSCGFEFTIDSQYWNSVESAYTFDYIAGVKPYGDRVLLGYFNCPVPEELRECVEIIATTPQMDSHMSQETELDIDNNRLNVYVTINYMEEGHTIDLSYELRLQALYDEYEQYNPHYCQVTSGGETFYPYTVFRISLKQKQV